MSTSTTRQPLGHTRWRRFAACFVPASVACGGLLLLTAQGALAASFHVSGLPATLTADKMVGTGFAQYGYFDATNANASAGIDPLIPVAITGIKSAKIYNLCQSVSVPALNVSLVIKAGTDSTKPVEATNLFIDMTKLQGDASFTNIDIGGDASETTKGPSGQRGPQNMFAQQADTIEINNLKQTMYATSAGTFKLNNLNMEIKFGTYTCPL